jgi:hypothetical protein
MEPGFVRKEGDGLRNQALSLKTRSLSDIGIFRQLT